MKLKKKQLQKKYLEFPERTPRGISEEPSKEIPEKRLVEFWRKFLEKVSKETTGEISEGRGVSVVSLGAIFKTISEGTSRESYEQTTNEFVVQNSWKYF